MNAATRIAYEVDADMVEVITPEGRKRWLGRGADLPAWVEPDAIADLVASGAVTALEVI